MNKETKEDYAGRIGLALRVLDTVEKMLLDMMYELIPPDDSEHEKEPIESFLTNEMKNIKKEVPDITNIGVIPAYEPKTHEGQTIPPTQVKQQEKQMNPQKKYYRKHRQEILQKEKEKYIPCN